jgi:hypothetical protein
LNMLDNDYSEDLSLFEAEKTPCLAFSNWDSILAFVFCKI